MPKIADIDVGEFPLLLAPMEDVSDPPFRALCKKHGADLVYTEFISSEGLIRDAGKSTKKLDVYQAERPVGIQIFGSEIEHMKQATEISARSGPDLIDINFGCPVRNVVCKGAGAAILKDVDKMVRMTEEIVQSTELPVTVKTRLGWDDDSKYIEEVVERLQEVGVQAVSIHGRTRVQMYKGEADWTLIGNIAQNPYVRIPVFGNGDVDSPQKALEYKENYKVDGIMMGRAAIGYPWIFREVHHYLNTGKHMDPPTVGERVEAVRDHLDHSIEWKGEKKAILEMRKHYGKYFKGLPHFKPYRQKLVTSEERDELESIFDAILTEYGPEEIATV
jgi:nifR3 family TIM-barrel protein